MQKTCLQPGLRSCANNEGGCQSSFEITDEDLSFYEKIAPVFGDKKYPIPPPTHCPDCRLQRRLTWRNERALHRRMCNKSNQPIISVHSSDAPYPVYSNPLWWGDTWDGKEYGVSYDFHKPFFEQFHALYQCVPQLAIVNDNTVRSENCEYCQDFSYGRNCYFVLGTWDTQDSLYANSSDHSRNIADCFFVQHSELCYECQNAMHLYNCRYVEYAEQCSDYSFGYDLIGCKNCFLCFGLRQKQFCIFNEQYSEEEYKKKVATYNCSSLSGLQRTLSQYREWLQSKPRRGMYLKNCEDCLGDVLFNCKNTYGFHIYNADHARYYDRGDSPLYTHDVFQSGKNQYCYEGLTPDESYQTLFTTWCWKDKYVLYSDNCHSCEHCFGCISLKRAKYCILNTQYTQEEYEALVPKIIEQMMETGEWGEFFPRQLSPFPYNETVAQEYYPLSKEQAEAQGLTWRNPDDRIPNITRIIPAKRLPDNINNIPDDILNWAIICEETGRPFKIIKQELEFYRAMQLPIPHLHPDERHMRRMALRNPRKLWERKCDKCSKDVKSTYSPERNETVYCEECYLAEVY